ncbi:MAG: cold shock domain-containing protein [Anaerolineae bacterium]|jgi:CspA family cold shock protein
MSYRDTWATCEECGKRFVFTVEEQRRLEESGADIEPPSLCKDCRGKADLSSGPHEGVVKWYDPAKGYGFIIQSSGNEIFFHRTGIAQGTAEQFSDGARVTYLVEEGRKGPQAVEVALMNEEERTSSS